MTLNSEWAVGYSYGDADVRWDSMFRLKIFRISCREVFLCQFNRTPRYFVLHNIIDQALQFIVIEIRMHLIETPSASWEEGQVNIGDVTFTIAIVYGNQFTTSGVFRISQRGWFISCLTTNAFTMGPDHVFLFFLWSWLIFLAKKDGRPPPPP